MRSDWWKIKILEARLAGDSIPEIDRSCENAIGDRRWIGGRSARPPLSAFDGATKVITRIEIWWTWSRHWRWKTDRWEACGRHHTIIIIIRLCMMVMLDVTFIDFVIDVVVIDVVGS